MGGAFEGQGRNVLRATARRRPVADCFDRTMKDYGVGKFALRLRGKFFENSTEVWSCYEVRRVSLLIG